MGVPLRLIDMPRKARLDAPGALHHIIVRGIQRCMIFRDNADRDDFPERLGGILGESQTPCFAWALMPNHFHLLLRTGQTSISTVMQRLLTGRTVAARSLLCYWANRELGMSTVELSRRLRIAQPTVSQSVARVERTAVEMKLTLLE